MPKLIKNRTIRRGIPPGGFPFSELPISEKMTGHYIRYNETDYIERDFDPALLNPQHTMDSHYIHWFHIEGFIKEDFFRLIRDTFQIPSLQMADLLNIDHHPKIEDLDDLLFFLLKSVDLENNQGRERLRLSHVGIFLGDHFVLTFSERPIKSFDFVKERLRQKKGKIRERKEDFLFYSLIDSIVNNYFYVIEILGVEVEALEHRVTLQKVDQTILPTLNHLKTEFLLLRKLIYPVNEAVLLMNNLMPKIFDEDMEDYITDLTDHSKQILSVVQSYYTMLNDILQIYATHINFQTNRIITFLTLFTSIFIPLTFIVGVYGMNFHYMPELDWKYGYPFVWGINIFIAVTMVVIFRIKKWL